MQQSDLLLIYAFEDKGSSRVNALIKLGSCSSIEHACGSLDSYHGSGVALSTA